jgi:hypothetical protein
METRAGHQGRQALHELQRLNDDVGGMIYSRLSTYLVVESGDFQNAPNLLSRRLLFSTTPAA